MELRHLRYFLAVADQLNFTKAGAKLRVAQPALSRQIRDLEAELGVTLLERSSRSVRLTDAGKNFVREASEVLRRAEQAIKSAQAFATGERGEIQVGFAPSLTVEILPKALQAFERECPQVRVILHDLSIQEMLSELKRGRLHLALTLNPLGQVDGITFQPIRAYPICIAIHSSHRLARVKRLTMTEIRRERLLVYGRDAYPEYHEWLQRVLGQEFSNALENAQEHESGPSLIAAIEAGRGIAVVPSVIASAAGTRLRCRKILPSPPPMVVGVAFISNRISPAGRRFVEQLANLRFKSRGIREKI